MTGVPRARQILGESGGLAGRDGVGAGHHGLDLCESSRRRHARECLAQAGEAAFFPARVAAGKHNVLVNVRVAGLEGAEQLFLLGEGLAGGGGPELAEIAECIDDL